MSLESLHRLSLTLGASLDRTHECSVFVDWLKAEAQPRLIALFVAEPGRESLRLIAASGFKKTPSNALPLGHDPWEWLKAQNIPLPRGEKYALPITLEGELFGLLAVISMQKGDALNEEQRLLDLALAYLAPILRNIEKHENVERLVEERTAQLRQSEERYRSLVNSLPELIYAISPEGKITFLNPAFEQITGWPVAAWLGRSFEDLIHPDDRPLLRERFARALKTTHTETTIEVRIHTASGKLRILEVLGVAQMEDSRVIGVTGYARDITEHKQDEEALRASEERFRALAQSTSTAIFVYSGEKFIYVNRATEELTGYSANELLKLRFWDMVHPDFQEMVRQRGLARQRGEDVPSRYEFKIVRKDGEERWIDFTAGKIDWHGQPAAIGSAVDITERKQAEAKLIESERMLAEAQRLGNLGHTEWRAGKEELVCSAETLRIFELSSVDSPITKNMLGQRVHPEDRQRLAELDRQFFAKRTDIDYEYRLLFPDNRQKWIHQYGKVTYNQAGVPVRIINVFQDITARKQAEEALRASEERFRAYIERASDYIFSLDPQGRFAFVNQAMCLALGYLEKELLGQPALTVVSPEARQEASQVLQRIWSGETVDSMDLPVQTRQGKTLLVQIRGRGFYRDGQLVETLHIARDVTLQKQAEEAIKNSERRLSALIANGLDFISILDAQGNLLWESPSTNTLLGYRFNEFLGRSILELVHPEDLEWVQRQFAEVASKPGSRQAGMFRLRTAGNEYRWVEAVASNFLDDPAVGGIVINYRDITERKQAEETLRQSEEKYRTLIEQLPAIVYVDKLDGKGTTFFISPQIESILGISVEEWLSSDTSLWLGLIHPEDRPRVEQTYQQMTETNRPYDIEYRILTRHGKQLWIQDKGRILQDAAGNLLLHGVMFDISERKRHEREIQAEAMLAQALGETLELQPLLERLLEAARHAIPAAEKGSILLVEANGRLRIRALSGYTDPRLNEFTFASDSGYSARAARERKPLLIADARADDSIRYDGEIEEARQIHSTIAVPLLIREQVIGVIALDSTQKNAFSEEDLALLSAFATPTALIIQNARLFEEKTHLVERLQALHATSQEIIRRAYTPEQVYEAIYHAVRQLMPTDNFTIALHDQERGEFEGVYLIDEGQRYPPLRASIQEGITGQVIRTGKTLHIRDIRMEAAPAPVHYGSDKESLSYLCVPLRIGEKVIGAMSAQSYQPNVYQTEDEALLEMLASYAAPAIENARLLEETRNRAAQQSALNAVLLDAERTGGDLDAILNLTLDHLLQALNLEMGGIWLANEQRSVVRGFSIQISQEMAKAARTGNVKLEQLLVIDDYATSNIPLGDIAMHYGIRAAIVTPLMAGEKFLGGISVAASAPRRWREDEIALVELFGRQLGLLIQRARLFEETRRRAEETASLLESSLALSSLDLQTTLQTIGERAKALFQADGCRIFLLEPDGQSLRCVLALQENQAAFLGLTIPLGQGVTGQVALTGEAEIVNDMLHDPRAVQVPGTNEEPEALMFAPLKEGDRTIGVISIRRVGTERPFQPDDLDLLKAFAALAASAVANAHLYAEAQQRLRELETLQAVSSALRQARSVEEMLPIFVQHAARAVGAQAGSIYLLDENSGDWVSQGWVTAEGSWLATPAEMRHRPGEGVTGLVGESGIPYITSDWRSDPTNKPLSGELGFIENFRSGISLPLPAESRVIGVMHIWYREAHTFSENEKRLLTAIADMAGSAIQRARLHDETERRVEQLQSLQAIDQAITASLDPRVSLNILLEHTIHHLGVDAAGVLLMNPALHFLEYAAGRGFRTRHYERTSLRLGEGKAGRVALERRTWIIPDLSLIPITRKELIQGEGFVSYLAAPLLAKGQVKGVLEIFHRSPFSPTVEQMRFFEALAQQAAIAIENGQLFESLQRANLELSLAYDKTIEGWSRALDLRDRETEGHTQRVTALTIQLAQAMGLSEEQIMHLRRGALLHDIGKMGVPDHILFKEGPLTPEEWAIMRQHPQFAYEMLSSIEYLRPALEIPWCHHEKWDGSGYPRGLKGEQIPLAARIFAIADVFDALTSDRPYRKAWPIEQALQYIRQQAGSHFDPQIVEIFLNMNKSLLGDSQPDKD
jgi:PAS domain S-box-containing protein